MYKFFCLLFSAITSLNAICQSNLFSKELLDCIVSIEKRDSLGNLMPHGTGFLLYNYDNTGKSIVVTCEHLLRNDRIYVRVPLTDKAYTLLAKAKYKGIKEGNQLWLIDGPNLVTEFYLIKDSTFIKDETNDIGIFKIHIPQKYVGGKDTAEYAKTKSIPRSLFKERSKIELGTEIYFLGFPFALGTVYGAPYSDSINTPLLRTGIIAWKSNKSAEFLLDAFSYSGNSGSPLFSQRDIFGNSPYLIGMVKGHLRDPGLNRNVDINIGLARCVWINEILTLLSKSNLK